MEDWTPDPIRDIIATFRAPDRSQYPELDGYTRDELYQDCSGGGGLYLATRMIRTMRLRAGDIVLDLGCGKGAASLFLAKHWGVKVIAVDLWTSATFLNQKFTARGYRGQIVPLHMDVTHELPFAEDYLDVFFA
jgi:ubiquinone/menaquinone biosynthesis C-methylase UbiE